MNTKNVFRWMIKLATVALTTPVTWVVLTELGVGLPFVVQHVTMPLAGVVLVEATLMYAWWLLDNERQASAEQRLLYAIVMVLAYGAITAIALRHGEGLVGLLVRLVMAGVMAMSFVEAGILAWLKIERQADGDIHRDHRVRRHARRTARAEAIADRSMESEVAKERRNATRDVRIAAIKAERQQQLNAIAMPSVTLPEAVTPAEPVTLPEPVIIQRNGNGNAKVERASFQ